MEFDFPVPRGSGLGTSSAMNVALAALNSPSQSENPHEISEQAFLSESKITFVEGKIIGPLHSADSITSYLLETR